MKPKLICMITRWKVALQTIFQPLNKDMKSGKGEYAPHNCPPTLDNALQMAIEGDWNGMEQHINATQHRFGDKLRKAFPNLTENDLHIIYLIRIGKDHAEIARFLHIKTDSFRISRSRLKKKMGVNCDSISSYLRNLYR